MPPEDVSAEETQPVKRVTRGRKPAAKPEPPIAASGRAADEPPDPRIGQKCDPNWAVVAFTDTGRQYRCEGGVIVERVR